MLLTLGRDQIAEALVATGRPNHYGDTGAVLKISSATSTTFTVTATDVGGNPFAMLMENTYPIVTVNAIDFRGLAATNKANHEWNHWGISNATATGVGDLLNLAYESLGTKTNSQSWQITATITVKATGEL